MNFSHYTDQSVQAAAALVNTKGHPSGREYMGTPELARTFLAEHGFSGPLAVTATDLVDLHTLRTHLEAVFYAPDENAAAEALNSLLGSVDVRPQLTDHDGNWHFHYTADDARLGQRVAAVVAMGLATVVAEHGFSRLGICAADDCVDVFVDTSRNRSRRYCTDSCSSRTNVAAFRARAKETSKS